MATNINATETNINATETNINATETNINATETNIDAIETNINATEVKADATEVKADATEVKADATEKAKKVTKSQRFSDIKALLLGEKTTYGTTLEKAITVIDHEIELLAKKNSGEKKKTEIQIANDNYKALIVQYLGTLSEDSVGVTCSEIGKAIPELSEFNNQKISALLRQLCTANVVEKTVSKGKSYFMLK